MMVKLGVMAKPLVISDKVNVNLTPKEVRLIEELRKTPFGEILIIMHDGQPRRIERVREKVQL